MITSFDIPKYLLTDRGSAFNSELSQLFSKLTGIEHNYAIPSPRHEAIGSVERSNRTIEDMLRKYLNKIKQDDWHKYLPYLAYAENKAISRSHNFSPDYLMFGREPRKFLELDQISSEVNKQIYEKEFIKNITNAWDAANTVLGEYRNKMIESRMKELGRRKPVTFKIGDKVWLDAPPNSRIKNNSEKLSERSSGPYEIIEILENKNIKVKITPSKTEIFKPNQLRKLKNQHYDMNEDQIKGSYTEVIIIPKPPLPPAEDTEQEVKPPSNLNIESIVGKRVSVFWPVNKKWYKALVIGFTATKSKNLLYYDRRTPDADPREDFFQEILFPTINSKQTVKWKLLTPKI